MIMGHWMPLQIKKAASGVCNLPKTDRNGYTHLDNLELGLYLFVETEVPEQVTDTVNPWFVQLPFTSADGDMWQYDMNVYPKNQSGIRPRQKCQKRIQQ